MADKVFIDTNVFVYAHDRHDSARRERAMAVIAGHATNLVISTQVMQEFFVAATGKLGITDLNARQILKAWQNFEVVGINPARIHEAIDIKILHQISFWDSLIIAAAASAHCPVLLSEDLNDGQIIAGVRVTNPFG